jgi:hypothetical protein
MLSGATGAPASRWEMQSDGRYVKSINEAVLSAQRNLGVEGGLTKKEDLPARASVVGVQVPLHTLHPSHPSPLALTSPLACVVPLAHALPCAARTGRWTCFLHTVVLGNLPICLCPRRSRLLPSIFCDVHPSPERWLPGLYLTYARSPPSPPSDTRTVADGADGVHHTGAAQARFVPPEPAHRALSQPVAAAASLALTSEPTACLNVRRNATSLG